MIPGALGTVLIVFRSSCVSFRVGKMGTSLNIHKMPGNDESRYAVLNSSRETSVVINNDSGIAPRMKKALGDV